MWYVIIQRILSGIFVGSLGAAAVVFVVSGIAKKREIKRLKQQAKEERKVKQEGEVQPEEQKEEENNAQIPAAVKQMQKDALAAGLKCYETGNLLAACKETKWIMFMREAVNSGELEQSIKEKHLDNAMIYTAEGGAVFRLQGKLSEITKVLTTAPLNGKEVVVVYDAEKDEKSSYEVVIPEKNEKPAVDEKKAEEPVQPAKNKVDEEKSPIQPTQNKSEEEKE